MRLDDPTLVAEEYADETRLRKRAAAHAAPNDAVDPRAAGDRGRLRVG